MKFRNLALLGISFGMLLNGVALNADEMTPEMRSFYENLEPRAKQKFLELDNNHRKKALEVLNSPAGCRGASECRGHREQAVEEQYRLQMKERERSNGSMK